MQVKSGFGRRFNLPVAEEEAEISGGFAADQDACELDDAQSRALRPVGQLKAVESKQKVSIRLSPELLRFFRSIGND
jgi:hypothetical protein